MRLTTTILLLLSCSLFLTACASNPPSLLVDPALLECRAEPIVPPRPVTNRHGARFTKDAVLAGRDCRRKLAAVKAVVEQARSKKFP